jgi:hypothetical protein
LGKRLANKHLLDTLKLLWDGPFLPRDIPAAELANCALLVSRKLTGMDLSFEMAERE